MFDDLINPWVLLSNKSLLEKKEKDFGIGFQRTPSSFFVKKKVCLARQMSVFFSFCSAEAPEEEHDPRSLYDRLQEQKDKKQQEYEETFKLSKFVAQLKGTKKEKKKKKTWTNKTKLCFGFIRN